MNRILYIVIGLLFISKLYAQDSAAKGIIKDAKTKAPLPYTIITDENEFLYYGLTDTLGNFRLIKEDIAEKIKFHLLGYKPAFYNSDSIPEIIYLEPKAINIPEVIVKGISVKQLIEKASKTWKRKYRDAPYLAKGLYTKTVECKNQYLEFIQGYGYFMGSGYKSYKKFDNYQNSYFKFIMTQARISNCYAKAGQNILLSPKTAYSKKISYNSGNREVFMAYRAIEAFGPLSPKKSLFSKPPRQYYKFNLDTIIDDKDKIYKVSFKTIDGYIPSKLKLKCHGKLWINGSNYNIIKYSFDFLNYMYIPFFRASNIKLPYLAKLNVTYDIENNQLFPKKLNLVKYWAKNPGKEYSSFPPSRMRPAVNNLVEKERFKFIEYATGNDYESITINKTPLKKCMGFIESNPKINYQKSFWNKIQYKPDEWSKIQSDLSTFESLENQFTQNHNKYYYSFHSLSHINNNHQNFIKKLWKNNSWIKQLQKEFNNR